MSKESGMAKQRKDQPGEARDAARPQVFIVTDPFPKSVLTDEMRAHGEQLRADLDAAASSWIAPNPD